VAGQSGIAQNGRTESGAAMSGYPPTREFNSQNRKRERAFATAALKAKRYKRQYLSNPTRAENVARKLSRTFQPSGLLFTNMLVRTLQGKPPVGF
jgi:hypothetical protein